MKLFTTILFFTLSLTLLGYELRDAQEFTERNGLVNFHQKLKSGQITKVAYFGGSITAQPGYRVSTPEQKNASTDGLQNH